jgi:YegS/Rv2252/BmrU family lipid kinase
MNSRRAGFIVNPNAGGGRCGTQWAELQATFRQTGSSGEVLFTSRPGEAVGLAQALATECEIVVAVGGDGTIFEVASGILLAGNPRTLMGMVPLGTGNDTARLCGINDVAQAQAALRGDRRRALDTIRIRCHAQGAHVTRYALLYGSVGIIGQVLRQTTTRVKRLFGRRLAYPVGALRAIWSYQATNMRVVCDGQTSEKPFLLVSVSNSEYAGGGMRLAPGAKMEDGLLDVNLCEPVGRWRAIALLWRMCRGRHLSHPQLRFFTARSVGVDADPPTDVQADGEIIGHTPAQLDVTPRELKVLVPESHHNG